ncbi:cyanoexosortase B [Leptolyngbya sp. 7M]|uniref:cyanoexosortase B n=1 Tax=Leptolyngbya sp. 7M TaxID=2812896 RepID=UPI001B8AF583|nr:cyanoexosortase B [Leptolyngbya sp. 7M]QYO68319.1 cyanoexosortase B [Leptolyngbya sp. 7M]
MQISRKLVSIFERFQRHYPETAIGVILALLYVPLLLHWVDGWLNKSISTEHEYFSHGLIGLPFATYLAWQNRQQWQQLPNQTHMAGLGLLVVGVGCYLSNLTDLVNLSLVVILAGLCLWFKGVPGLRLQTFSLLLVLLATPNQIPYLIAPYTLPLQQFIAGMAGFILFQIGMEVRVDQIYLFVNDRIVEVAPYCAGLKMLFTSLYVGLILLYWTGAWNSRTKVIWFYSGVIALSVTANIIRNTLLTFFHGTGQAQAFDWLHDGWGGDLYSTAMLGLLLFLLQGINRWIVTDELIPALETESGDALESEA